MKINTLITANSVTLYWEKPTAATKNTVYEIFLDGAAVGKTPKTHFTVEPLLPEKKYIFEIRSELGSFSLEVTTSKEKNRIDVSAAPYFAKGDGETLNTTVLQAAIDACGENDVLYFPKGIYMTGALRLHSDMEIYVDEGATIQGTTSPDDFLPKIWSRISGAEQFCYASLINIGELDRNGGYNCKNVLIHGKGTIASGGEVLGWNITERERAEIMPYIISLGDKINEYENKDTLPGRVRPRLINMSNAQNVTISGVTLKNGPCWNVHMIYSDNIVTNDCTFISEGVRNGDGWDPDSSTNCTIFGCTFFTGDDCVAIKSGKNPEGNVVNRPCKHIRVFDCVSKYGHGICIGSEMSGGIDDVMIWDCEIANSKYGIEIKGTKKRGGYVRNVHVRDCKLPRIMFHSVKYNDDGISAGIAPYFESCTFEGVHLTGTYQEMDKSIVSCDAIELCGFDEDGHELKDIEFTDLTIGDKDNPTEQKISLRLCKNISFKNINCL